MDCRKVGLIVGFAFVVVVLSLVGYAIIPTVNNRSEIWEEDDKKYDNAYVTLATTDNSVLGVLVLAHTLRETHSKYPLIVMVSDEVSVPYLQVRTLLNQKLT
jgi:hypothetical protein